MCKIGNFKKITKIFINKSQMFYYILILSIVLDLSSKYFAYNYLQNKINLIWDFLFLQLLKNSWIAFSMKIPSLILKILTISLIIAIYFFYKKDRKEKKQKLFFDISFWLILAWSIWYWIERVFRSEVVDFIWIKYFSVFNLADSFIFIWGIIYLILVYKKVK
jgi:signal peptidase II